MNFMKIEWCRLIQRIHTHNRIRSKDIQNNSKQLFRCQEFERPRQLVIHQKFTNCYSVLHIIPLSWPGPWWRVYHCLGLAPSSAALICLVLSKPCTIYDGCTWWACDTRTWALPDWRARWSGVAGHVDWAARSDGRLDERVCFSKQHCLNVKTFKGSFLLCTWRATVLAKSMGIKTTIPNWPSSGIEIKQLYMDKLDSIVATLKNTDP